MKQCTRCKELKDESEFGERRKYKDGLSYWCKACQREYDRNRYRMTSGTRSRKYHRFEELHRVVRGTKQKKCLRCKKWRPDSNFYKKRKHKDGLAVWCKKCADEATNDCRRRRTAKLRAMAASSG
ncbi:MAG: hypothetical protein ACYS83_10440 [Planctomycetota bacterium]